MSNHDIESEADSQETTTGTHIHAETETYRYKDFNGKITCHEPDLIVRAKRRRGLLSRVYFNSIGRNGGAVHVRGPEV